MNYTEKYHLPQWKKEDRIMMEDFNRMCADMEAGLVQNREDARSDDRALNRSILRAAYNHYQIVKDMDPFPVQLGVFRQIASQYAIPGTDARDGARYMARASRMMEVRDFFKTITTVSDLTMEKNRPAFIVKGVCQFNSPMPGVFTAFRIRFVIRDADTTEKHPFRLSLKNMDTGKEEWSLPFEVEIHSASEYRYEYKTLKGHFHAGVNYQLILETSHAPGNGSATILLDDSVTQADLYGTKSGCTVTYSFDDVEESDDGLAFVRYRTAGPGGAASFKWNGKTVTPVAELLTPVEGEEPVREVIYRLPEHPMKGNEVSLTFQCREQGEIWFYEWGAILC